MGKQVESIYLKRIIIKKEFCLILFVASMSGKSLFKLKNYEIHSITTVCDGKMNANIASWVMQSAMKGKCFLIALDKQDFTIELVKQSRILNVNFLAEDQVSLINKLGRKSGRNIDKFKFLKYELDHRGCPYLSDSIGYIQGKVINSVDSLDHEIFICETLAQKFLNKDKSPLRLNYLREKGLIRG
ncbi:MAG: flavin reductase family protein [Candidatus Melainabacteria bacterium]|jgi:flavin reductase (DIM6/NTAB) family NADH-FMN oxidoreductase RutF